MYGSIHYNRMSFLYSKRAGIYKNSTGSLTFDPKTCEAHSYRWWKFVAVVEGKVVFNNYRYSVSTSKHQSKVRSLLNDLNIKIDLELPLPQGINSTSLNDLILVAEESLCDQILNEELKKQERYQKAKARKFQKKLEDYLENSVCFRDYEIKPKDRFGSYNIVAVHQCVDSDSMERDVENALYNFHRDGFGNVVFYV
jgi:hypothetical protein